MKSAVQNPPQPTKRNERPRILVITPEITYLPEGMGNLAQRMSAKAGGMADVSASLVKALDDLGADVHVGLPNYRRMFHLDVAQVFKNEFEKVSRSLPEQRIHLAEDRVFYHRSSVYGAENHLIALAFQREAINHIIGEVHPDLIHCNDWMTGLLPAAARRFGIPSLFTVHNIHTERMMLDQIEDRGIDAAEFWQHLYFQEPPGCYEETRSTKPVDLLASGIFAADRVNTVSPTFLREVIGGDHDFVPGHIRHELWAKENAGCASGILNAPDAIFDPESDPWLDVHFSAEDHAEGKARNKVILQEMLGLKVDPEACLFYWPSRLDPVQKGCQLLTEILYEMIETYPELQIAIVASGSYQGHFYDIVNHHKIHERVAVRDFNEADSHRAYAASDFIFMPSSFEPCGLPQMIAPKYGSMTVAHDTGGLHDSVEPLSDDGSSGNGFRFQHFDTGGLRWGIGKAIDFHRQNPDHKSRVRERVMREAAERFTHETTARQYIDLYESMLGRPITDGATKA